jgi:CubicO group peptidase (beta-lactamase class C family)
MMAGPPLGAGYDADVTLDAHGNAAADGGISATLRDAGRIGLLALRRGQADGRQVVAPRWFDDTVRGAPDGPGAFLGGDGAGRGHPGDAHYRNCWRVIDPGPPLYCAAGVFGQFVFVHGPAELVMAKLSSWPEPSSPPLRTAMVAAVRAIASALSRE